MVIGNCQHFSVRRFSGPILFTFCYNVSMDELGAKGTEILTLHVCALTSVVLNPIILIDLFSNFPLGLFPFRLLNEIL